LRAVLSLVTAGVPWHVAERLKPHQLFAYRVIIGEMRGGDFNWEKLEWRKPS
jgi:hypothetical protein